MESSTSLSSSSSSHMNPIQHDGSCHCQAVKFSIKSPPIVTVFKCNCSICVKKQGWHFMVPKTDFHLLSGKDSLSAYQFNTKTARHMFCKHCGIHSFYYSRSHPNMVAVMPHCLDTNKIKCENIEYFDGLNWEEHLERKKTEGRGVYNEKY